MSLSIEIRVNGHPVAVLEAHNVKELHHRPGVYHYAGRLAQFTLDGETLTRKIDVTHKRTDSLVALAAELLREAVKP